MRKRHHWTDTDRATLRALYPEFSAAECAAAIGCSVSSINNQAHALGLRKSREWIARRAAERSARPDHGGLAHQLERAIAERDETIRQLRAQLGEYEREKLKRESQEPVAFRWLGPGKGWRAVYAAPPVPRVDPDWLSNVIRTVAPHICAERDELAEKIAEAINGRVK